MDTEEHEELADEFDRRADQMERENQRLADEIDAVRKDWEAKRDDAGVPGAVPHDQETGDQAPAADEADPAD